ncbi:hypothetical protein HY612_05335 [Candidatus Roizmanbacteria bacterium]|nr:hypothetical protein [Candidatus Roizmanbacteria bacterium]
MYRIDKLLKEENRLFHTNDLSLLWEIKNKNTLYTAIKRYVKKRILIPIHKGFYATVEPDLIHPYRFIGSYLHRYCYISCETVLFATGAIFQKGNYITALSNLSKKFSLGTRDFLVRKMMDEFLYNLEDVVEKNGYFIAGLERAVADMLYFNRHYHFDNRRIINWEKVKAVQKGVGYV